MDANKKELKREYYKKYYAKNKEKLREYERNRSQIRKQNPKFIHQAFVARLKYKYNLSEEIYNKMVFHQKGLCAICLRPPALKRRLHVDHDHTTKRVRGLLCAECNWYMRFLDKDPSHHIRLIMYGKHLMPWESGYIPTTNVEDII